MKNIIQVLKQVWNYLFDFQFRLAPLWRATPKRCEGEKGRSRGVYLFENQIHQNFLYIILIILIMFTLSCSLDRTNPLDPLVSGKVAPEKVPNIHIATTADNTIMINWNPMSNVNGYYIYRSQSYDGLYELIMDENDETVSSYEDQEVTIPGNFYWYKMSAYILVGEEKLEGYRSEPKTWN